MKNFLVFILGIFLILFLAVLRLGGLSDSKKDSQRVIRVFTYSSFTTKSGPGPEIKKRFEKICGDCTVEFVEGRDAVILMQRLKLEGESLGADLVIGLDQFEIKKALQDLNWKKINSGQIQLEPELGPFSLPQFVPYDWGALTFVGRGNPESRMLKLEDLLLPEYSKKFVIQDPRTSSPGLHLMSWINSQIKSTDRESFIVKLKQQAFAVSPNWSTAYSLFSTKKVDMVFSYSTSPLYHRLIEKSDDVFAYESPEALPIQVEYLGIPAFCQQCELAEQLANFILSPEGQSLLVKTNFMLPAIYKGLDSETLALIPKPVVLKSLGVPEVIEIEKLMDQWNEAQR